MVGDADVIGHRDIFGAQRRNDAEIGKPVIVQDPLEGIAQHLPALGKSSLDNHRQLSRVFRIKFGDILGIRHTNADRTLGGGSKLSGGTSISHSMWKRYCSMTEIRLKSESPGTATMRSTTSFCSMKCMSRMLLAYSAK